MSGENWSQELPVTDATVVTLLLLLLLLAPTAAAAAAAATDLFFASPSAFSIHLKRLVNPTRKADDGWKTVKYEGK